MPSHRRYAFILAALVAAACRRSPQTVEQIGQTQVTYKRGVPDTITATRPPSADTGRRSDRDSAEVELSVDRASYPAGTKVQLRLTSNSRDTLGFNPCTREIERLDGTQWVAHPEPDRVCTMEIWLLAPDETRSAPTDLPRALTRGTYRIALVLIRQQPPPAEAPRGWERVRAVSGPFQIE